MRPKIVSGHDKQCKQLLASIIKLRNFEISDLVVKRIPNLVKRTTNSVSPQREENNHVSNGCYK